jgi:prepilin-type N-terminal cleavage/methylation domain-containing protein
MRTPNFHLHLRRIKSGAGCRKNHAAAGMTLIELMIAMTVMAIGLPACMLMILVGIQTNARNKTDTTATVLDQEVIEKFTTLQQYPKPGTVIIYDCALSGGQANQHSASLGQAPAPGAGATTYTAPPPTGSGAQIGDIDWTAAAPTMATSTTAGYAMQYQTCSGDIYEVRWNIREISPNPTSKVSLLTVSARQRAAIQADAGGGQNRAILYAKPVTLRTMIESR